jgi:hypothetical protein
LVLRGHATRAHVGPGRRGSQGARWARAVVVLVLLGLAGSGGLARAAEGGVPGGAPAARAAERASKPPDFEAAPEGGVADGAARSRRQRAREHYQQGLAHHDAGALELALREFERAYAISGHHQVLFAVGQLCVELGRWGKARQSLEGYLLDGGHHIPDARRDEVDRQLAELSRRTGVVVVTLDGAPAALDIQGQHLESSDRQVRLAVDAGRVPIVARRVGFPAIERSLWVPAGGLAELALEFPEPMPVIHQQPLQVYRVAAWTSAGVLSLGAIGTGVATYLSSRQYDRLRSRATDESAESARDRLDRQRDRVQDLALATDALALAGLAAAGAALYFSLSGSPSGPMLALEPARLVAVGEF